MAVFFTIPSPSSNLVSDNILTNIELPAYLTDLVFQDFQVPKRTPPYTGEPDSFGERSCVHNHFSDLSLELLPPGSGFEMVTTEFPPYTSKRVDRYCVLTLNGVARRYQADFIVCMGVSGSYDGGPSHKADAEWHWSGNELYVTRWFLKGRAINVYEKHGSSRCCMTRTVYSDDYSTYRYASVNISSQVEEDLRPQASALLDASPLVGPYRTSHVGMLGGTMVSTAEAEAYVSRLSVMAAMRVSYTVREPNPDWKGVLSQSAAEQTKLLDTNLLTQVPEMLHLRRSLGSLVEQLTDPRTYRNARRLADLHLSMTYGPGLTINETFQQAERLRRHAVTFNDASRARSRLSYTADLDFLGKTASVFIQYTCKCWYGSSLRHTFDPITEIYRAGLIPTLEDVWDLIPYSFVVDWIVGVNKFLSQLDAQYLIARLPVFSVVFGRRLMMKGDVSFLDSAAVDDGIRGTFTYVEYSREVGTKLVPPTPSLQSTVSSFDNWSEASALFIQRVAKY